MHPVSAADMLRFFFRASGRIGRMEYILGAAFIYCCNGALLFYLLAHTDFEVIGPIIIVILGIPSSAAFLVLAAKRCHDLALPGSFILLLVVPIFGLLWLVALMLMPGNAGPNLYGPAPRFGPD